MKKNLHLSSLIAPAALLAATSAWAANCPEHTQWNQKYNECYIDLYGAEAGGTTEILVDPTKHVSSFKVYGYSANHTVIVKSANVAWTFSVTGSASMKEGDKLTIKNGINFAPFSKVIEDYETANPGMKDLVESLIEMNKVQGAMFECKNANCEVPKQTGFNSLVIEAQATQASSGMDLTVQHEIFDFWTTTVFNVKGVNRSFASLLLGVAGIQFDLSKVPEDATTLALVDADFDRKNLAKKAHFVNLDREILVDMVYFNRTFTKSVTEESAFSTLTLPFDLNTNYALGLKRVLKFNGIKTKDVEGVKKSYVSMKPFWSKGDDAKTIEAYKPYLVEMETEAMTIASPVTLKKAPIGLDNPFDKTSPTWDEHDGWVFYGTLAGCQWTNDEKYMPQHEDGEEESGWNYIEKYRDFYKEFYARTFGKTYGYAASDVGSTIKAGQFVKAGEGAYIGPYRAFLWNTNTASGVKGAGSKSFSVANPEVMDVVIEDEDEQKTTVIGRFNTRTGEFLKAENRVFDLKGRSVKNNAPRARGAYYGKKSVVR